MKKLSPVIICCLLLADAAAANISVSDVTGRTVAAVPLNTQHFTLNTSNFTSGIYFITLTDKEGRSSTQKLIIEK